MKRRVFIQKSIGAGLFASAVSTAPGINNLFAHAPGTEMFDLVAIKGGEPAAMFDKAIQAFGGIQKFVKKGQTVVVKPNIGWNKTPEYAANTNPQLTGQIVKHCYAAGAKIVYVFDNTCNNWQKCYTNSGIEKSVKDAGGKMVPGNTESYYHGVQVNKGKKLQSSKVHELILESDVFINVPVLKNHGGAALTMTMKNLMGIVWDRSYWHRNDLHQCIADFSTYRQPDLNILDAYRVMMRNGPQGVSTNDVVNMKSLFISTNMVSIDAAGAKMFGMEPEKVGYIPIANQMGVGEMDLSKLNIKKMSA
ncbi:MAG: DUF362 domain-containing protein [Bacteroidetes bacterium]|jgi:uncharacterized protein (DUF362 family)|nr:DUF362 domain-containing protein [Bacteroidota bacterium]